MDQSELHALEARCIHDAPPPCNADCPLGVDARGVLEAVAEGRFDDGLQLLTARVLLPALLCRVCEEPCRAACPRRDTGGSLQVRALEAACVAYGAERATRRVPPRKGSVAVVGGGLAGMTAALDLALRGYSVRLLEARDGLGGRLRDDVRLPEHTLLEAADRLERAGVHVERGTVVDAAGMDALFANVGVVILTCAGLERPPTGNVLDACAPDDGAFVQAAAAARRAAAAADLILRGLPPSPPGVAPRSALPAGFGSTEPPVTAVEAVDASAGFSAEEAAREAVRCLRCACRECQDVCLFLERSTSSPKALIREINNNLVVTPGMGYRASKAIINACRLCGLCAEVCPADIDFGEVCREARRGLCERDAMPPAVHEPLLRDVAASNDVGFALVRHQPGLTASRSAFFPGCQLPASRPAPARAAYEFLTTHLDGGVGLVLGCCGAPAVWAGRDDEAKEALAAVSRAWESLGRPTFIVACPSCARTLADARPDIPLAGLWEVLDGLGPLKPVQSPGGVDQWAPLAVHDPCAMRHDEAAQAAVRRLLHAAGCDHRSLPRSGRLTECCGFGGLQHAAAPELAAATLERQTGADERAFVTTCAMCRDQFAGAGKPTVHLLDVLFGTIAGQEAAFAPGPTWSERRAARERFSRAMARDLWGEDVRAPGPPLAAGSERVPAGAAGLPVEIPAAVRRSLDEAFVLESDVAAAIAAAEAGGAHFSDPSGAVYSSVRCGSVTVWVGYSQGQHGPVVFDCYSHRTEVLGVVATVGVDAGSAGVGVAAGVRCGACDLQLGERPVRLAYLGTTFDVELPACPSCGAVFVPAAVATGRMREVEMSLEDK